MSWVNVWLDNPVLPSAQGITLNVYVILATPIMMEYVLNVQRDNYS